MKRTTSGPTKPAGKSAELQLVRTKTAKSAGKSKGTEVDALAHSTAFVIIAIISIAVLAMGLLVALFDSGLRYKLSTSNLPPIESEKFLNTIEDLTDSRVFDHTDIQVLTNGETYYEAELEAIRNAQKSINFEAYIFQSGEVTKRFLAALTERAHAGVKINLVVDAVGSAGTFKSELKALRDAGGKFAWYHPLWWNTWMSFNNRTHREIIVVDGSIAFIGGSGFADHWLISKKNNPRWRDTMVRVEGAAVSRIQAIWAENWLESTGEVIAGDLYFPFKKVDAPTKALVVASTPSAGGSTRSRIMYQALIDAAQKTIHITTPYFLPDRGAREALERAAKRGVDVRLLVPGDHSDHFLSRKSSRRMYGPLLKAGARIFEYTPAMIHAKVFLVDGCWSVVGSTNFDSRSFRLNDEINLAVSDPRMYNRLEQDFRNDLATSEEITMDKWQKRSIFDRFNEYLGWVLERQE